MCSTLMVKKGLIPLKLKQYFFNFSLRPRW
jgi:hypothetical protein